MKGENLGSGAGNSMGISIIPILSVLTQIYQRILLASYEASRSQATQEGLTSPCPAWPWGQWRHPGQAWMSPQPHHARLCLVERLGGPVQLVVLAGEWKPTRKEPVETLQASNAVV